MDVSPPPPPLCRITLLGGLLKELAGRSLVSVRTDEDGAARYEPTPPLLRALAAGGLPALPADEIRRGARRHAAWFYDLVNATRVLLPDTPHAPLFARMRAERENLGAVLAWCLKNDPEWGADLITWLLPFWRE